MIVSVPATLGAQAIVLSGSVVSDSRQAVDNALVSLDPDERPRVTRTDDSGRFVFTDVAMGMHTVRVNGIGFTPVKKLVFVGSADTSLVITMHAAPASLDTIRVSTTREGVFGFVGDLATYRALPGTVVHVIGAEAADTTDSTGRYDLPAVPSGRTYVVRMTHPGYTARTIAVSMPRHDGYDLSVFLHSTSEPRHDSPELWNEFDARVHMGGFGSALVPRTSLGDDMESSLLTALLRSPAVLSRDLRLSPLALGDPMDPSYPCLFVDGKAMPQGTSLDEFTVGDVESVEVYGVGTTGDATLKQTRVDGLALGGYPCGNYLPQSLPVGPASYFPAPISRNSARTQIGSVVIWIRQ